LLPGSYARKHCSRVDSLFAIAIVFGKIIPTYCYGKRWFTVGLLKFVQSGHINEKLADLQHLKNRANFRYELNPGGQIQ